jgi:hypothetical protein
MSREAVQNAILAADYALAAERFEAYARALPADHAGLNDLAALIDWARVSVQQARAHAQARLQALRDESHVATSYRR